MNNTNNVLVVGIVPTNNAILIHLYKQYQQLLTFLGIKNENYYSEKFLMHYIER